MSHRFIPVFSALLLCGSTIAQNLVPNWSFEEYNLCPDSWNEVERATGWHKSTNNNNPQYHTDYCNSCATGNFDVPNNILGNQQAATGSAYMMQVTMAPTVGANYRENIYIQLIEPLIPGQDYDVHFKVSSADDCENTSNNQGAKFSTVPNFPVDGNCQVHSQSIITDKLNWMEISGSFTADSAYAYVCIGNFFPDAQTLFSNSCPNCTSPLYSYYVDDVCVMPKNSSTSDCSTAFIPARITEVMSSLDYLLSTTPNSIDLQFAQPLTSNTSITLADVEGRQLGSTMLNKGTTSYHLANSSLAPGAYLIILETKGTRLVRRFVQLR